MRSVNTKAPISQMRTFPHHFDERTLQIAVNTWTYNVDEFSDIRFRSNRPKVTTPIRRHGYWPRLRGMEPTIRTRNIYQNFRCELYGANMRVLKLYPCALLILMGSPRGAWPCIVRPGFPTIDHDMNLSNTVKLLSRILFLQLIAGSIEKYDRNRISDTGVRSVRRLPKIRRKLSPAISAAACNFQIIHRVRIGRVIEQVVVVVR